MKEDDRDLIERYRDGDIAAMDALVERYRRPLYAFLWNLNGAREADDVYQETWFRALNNIRAYRQGNFYGWLIRIARNLTIDRARRKQPDCSLDEERADGSPLRTPVDERDADPGERAEQSDFADALRRAVARLPQEQKEVFLLRVQTETPFRAIAAAQGVSLGTALARMQYALDKLRRELAEYEDGRTLS
jgi:RNA polymerase sigma-70 factor, ECF subfamily